MRRTGGALAVILLAMPSIAAAQKKPSNSMHTRSAQVYLDRAVNAREPERTELLTKSLEVLDQGTAADAGNPRVWFMKGQVHVRLGNAASADSAFDRAQQIYPAYAAEIEPERLALWISEFNQGVAAVQEARIAEAIAHFEAATLVFDGRPDAHVTLGSLYAQAGDLAKAEAAYRAAVAIAQGTAAGRVEEKDRAQWQEQEETAVSRLGSLLMQTGRADEAVAAYASLVGNQPANARAKAELAAALAKSGRTDDAARVYDDLLRSGELTEVEWFNAGVGLYGADQYELAAKAFRKAIEANPYARDALYNLGQAIYAAASAAEEQRAASPESGKAAIGDRIRAFYEELHAVAERIRELDPNFRNALLMMAQAERSLADLAADPATAKPWQDRAVATLEQAESMPFDVDAVEMSVSEGMATVSGRVTNHTLAASRSVVLEFTLIGEGGAGVATQQVTVTAGEAESATPFTFAAKVDRPVLGWKYRVVS